MLKLRITYEKEEPFNIYKLINFLKENGYTIVTRSREYELRNGEYYNVYINIEKEPK